MKKYYTVLVILISISTNISSQTFVSTISENKNVILEDFTGVRCGYCPDGHSVANNIKSSNPNDVFLINIHAGGYAAPQTGYPDYTTSWNDAINTQTNNGGYYPNGTVNRHSFSSATTPNGTAMSRGDWDAASTQTLNESSYVNVSAQSSIDLQNRLLTVVVEVYYTDSTSSPSNKLNVALLQNNIAGYQISANSNPSQVLPNGDYNHMHMLRHLLTGQWGENISNTSQGDFYTNTFTYTIPPSLNGVAYDLFNLEVVVFVSESQQEIINGEKSTMNLITPPGTAFIDLQTSSNMVAQGYCLSSVTPTVTVKNMNADSTLDTYDVSYIYNSGSPVTLTETNLLPGATRTTNFPIINLIPGSHDFTYSSDLSNSTTYIDNVTGNNSYSFNTFSTISSVANNIQILEDFESYSIGDDDLNNSILENPDALNTFVVDNQISNSVNWSLGAFGLSDKSFRMRFYSWPVGSSASIVYENINLSNNSNPVLMFAHAYAQYSNESDQLKIEASSDCGNTWTILFNKSGDLLKTADPFSNGYYYPQIEEWDYNQISMSSFSNESSVMVRFTGIGADGNNLYLDDINIGSTTSISNQDANNDLKIYPNPANDYTNITLNSQNKITNLKVINLLGKVVKNINTTTNNYSLNLNDLSSGYYNILINSTDNSTYSRSIQVLK